MCFFERLNDINILLLFMIFDKKDGIKKIDFYIILKRKIYIFFSFID